MSIARYRQLSNNVSKFREVKIKAHIPKPEDVDYRRGFITRYFIQKVNDTNSQIFEVSSDNFSSYKENPFWNAVSIRWKISGLTQTQFNDDGSIKELSVSESNSRSITTVKTVIPNLKLYLPNLSQFFKK